MVVRGVRAEQAMPGVFTDAHGVSSLLCCMQGWPNGCLGCSQCTDLVCTQFVILHLEELQVCAADVRLGVAAGSGEQAQLLPQRHVLRLHWQSGSQSAFGESVMLWHMHPSPASCTVHNAASQTVLVTHWSQCLTGIRDCKIAMRNGLVDSTSTMRLSVGMPDCDLPIALP